MPMDQKMNIFKGSLTNYQLSEALEMTLDEIDSVLNGEIDVSALSPEVIDRISHLEDTLFGHGGK